MSCMAVITQGLLNNPWNVFDLILYVPVNNLSVMSGQVLLGWTSTKSCSRTKRSDASRARTHGPSVSSQALYHWATCCSAAWLCMTYSPPSHPDTHMPNSSDRANGADRQNFKSFRRKIINALLSVSLNICFGCSVHNINFCFWVPTTLCFGWEIMKLIWRPAAPTFISVSSENCS